MGRRIETRRKSGEGWRVGTKGRDVEEVMASRGEGWRRVGSHGELGDALRDSGTYKLSAGDINALPYRCTLRRDIARLITCWIGAKTDAVRVSPMPRMSRHSSPKYISQNRIHP